MDEQHGTFAVPGHEGLDGSVAHGEAQYDVVNGVVTCPAAIGEAAGWARATVAPPVAGAAAEAPDSPSAEEVPEGAAAPVDTVAAESDDTDKGPAQSNDADKGRAKKGK
jgi:hypothetical protein